MQLNVGPLSQKHARAKVRIQRHDEWQNVTSCYTVQTQLLAKGIS